MCTSFLNNKITKVILFNYSLAKNGLPKLICVQNLAMHQLTSNMDLISSLKWKVYLLDDW